jgi:hypothetical protein
MLLDGIARHWRSAIVLAILLAVVALAARSFVGSSSSPYGVCYATNGRAVPCEAIKR